MKKIAPHMWISGCIVLCTVLMLSTALFYWNTASLSFHTEGLLDFDIQWSCMSGGEQLPVTLPYKDTTAKAGDVTTFVGKLPAQRDNVALLFFTSHQTLQMEMGGQTIYRYDRTGFPSFIKSPGSFWHIIRLPDDVDADEIVVRLSCAYDSYAGLLSQVYVGTKAALMYYIIDMYGGNFLLTLLIMLLGICLVILYIAVRRRIDLFPQILHLGLFSGSVAGWLLGESRMLQFWFRNPVWQYLIVYLSLMQVGFWFLMFVWGLCGQPKSKVFQGLFILNGASVVIQTILQLLSIQDYPQMLLATHSILLLSSIFSVGYVIWSAYKGNQNAKEMILPVSILFGFALVETALYYWNQYLETTTYLQFGLFIFLTMMGTNQVLKIRKSLRQAQETQYFEKLAYTDFLTQLNNRTAYEKALSKICTTGDLRKLCAISFDLNNLKVINDRLGHAAGDDALCSLALYMRESVGKLGTLYRTGGDEFMCLCKDASSNALQQRLEQMQKRTENHHSRFGYELRVAYGYAVYDPQTDRDIQSLLDRADKNMYQVKTQMKGGQTAVR